jgi:hypothetical protein
VKPRRRSARSRRPSDGRGRLVGRSESDDEHPTSASSALLGAQDALAICGPPLAVCLGTDLLTKRITRWQIELPAAPSHPRGR